MGGAVPLLPPYDFMAYTGTVLPLPFLYISIRLHCATFLKENFDRKLANAYLRDLAMQYLEALVDMSPSVLHCSQMSWWLEHGRFLLFCFVVRTVPLKQASDSIPAGYKIFVQLQYPETLLLPDRNSGFQSRHKSSQPLSFSSADPMS